MLNDNNPEITLYQTQNGEWVCEDQSGITLLKSGSLVSAMDFSWYFVSAYVLESTKQANDTYNFITTTIEIYFSVSQDEEHVSLSIDIENKHINLGERIHHYLLLLLTRKRLADKIIGLDESDQGWIDKKQLSELAGLDENHINIQIYRF